MTQSGLVSGTIRPRAGRAYRGRNNPLYSRKSKLASGSARCGSGLWHCARPLTPEDMMVAVHAGPSAANGTWPTPHRSSSHHSKGVRARLRACQWTFPALQQYYQNLGPFPEKAAAGVVRAAWTSGSADAPPCAIATVTPRPSNGCWSAIPTGGAQAPLNWA